MNLSHLTLRRLVLDLEHLVGARIQEASLLNPNALVLDISRSAGGTVTRLLISGSRTQGRICVTAESFPSPPDRPPWVARYLQKAVIRSLDLQPDDRVLTLDLDKQDRVGSRYPSRLVIEMLGRDSNAALVDTSGKIQGVLRAQSNEGRRLHPGATFEPVSPQDRVLPRDLDPRAFQHAFSLAEEPAEALLKTCAGMDRLLAAEIVHRADQERSDLLKTAQHLYDNPPFTGPAGCVCSPSGLRTSIVPFQPTNLPPERFEEATSVSEAIETVFADSLKGQEKEGKRKGLRKQLMRSVKSARTKRARIGGDLEKARKAGDLERKGSLILASPQAIPQGASSVEIPDLFSDDEKPVRIELDSRQTATENGQAYLRWAAKARKSVPVLERRLQQTERDVAKLEGLVEELNRATDEAQIEALRAQLIEAGVIRPQLQKKRQGTKDPSGLHPRRYRTSDGWEVWVGRNDSENDRITKTVPRNALWFHAHGCPGSHVVLRPWDQREPSPEALHDAASLAAYWSKARGSKTVPVNYTEARYVQKPKGAPPGLVTIRNEKTIFVSPREIAKWEEST